MGQSRQLNHRVIQQLVLVLNHYFFLFFIPFLTLQLFFLADLIYVDRDIAVIAALVGLGNQILDFVSFVSSQKKNSSFFKFKFQMKI